MQDRQDRERDTVQDNELARMEINEAAVCFGITPDAVRKRIRRGQLRATKQDGHWFVVLPVQDQSRGTGQDQSRDTPQDTPRTDGTGSTEADATVRLVARLEDENAFLRRELENRSEEVQRLHVILAQLTERVPRLEAPVSERSDVQTFEQDVKMSLPRAPWWAFWRRPSAVAPGGG